MIIKLPWPPKELSQNARIHWAKRAKAVKAYRQECFLITKSLWFKIDWEGPIHLFIDFFPPDRRRYDDDGISGRFKTGRDGIADALGVDDNRFRQHPHLRGPESFVKGGKVVVKITKGPEEA